MLNFHTRAALFFQREIHYLFLKETFKKDLRSSKEVENMAFEAASGLQLAIFHASVKHLR